MTTEKPPYAPPSIHIEKLDKFFFICGANKNVCGDPSDLWKKIGTCWN